MNKVFAVIGLLLLSFGVFAQGVPSPLAIKVGMSENAYVEVKVQNLASGNVISQITNEYGEAIFNLGSFAFNGDSIKVTALGKQQSFTYEQGVPKTIVFDFIAECPISKPYPVITPLSCPPKVECPPIDVGINDGLTTGGYGFIAALIAILVLAFKGPIRIQKSVVVKRTDGTTYKSWKTITQKTYDGLKEN